MIEGMGTCAQASSFLDEGAQERERQEARGKRRRANIETSSSLRAFVSRRMSGCLRASDCLRPGHGTVTRYPVGQGPSVPDRASYFRIGVVQTALCTNLRPIRKQYRFLYRDNAVRDFGGAGIRIEVRRTPLTWRHRRRFEVLVNGRTRFLPARFDAVVPHIEWAVSWGLPELLPDHLQLHSSSLEVNGAGVIFPGHAGSGKSTLTVGMMTCGWRYLCDEFALLNMETLSLDPYPRAICIKEGAFPVMRALGIPFEARQRFCKGAKGWVDLIHPHRAFGKRNSTLAGVIGRSCPVRFVVFPQFEPQATPSLMPLTRAEAVLALHAVCFNLLPDRERALKVLTEAVRGAECYRLVTGDIHKTCDVLQRVVESR